MADNIDTENKIKQLHKDGVFNRSHAQVHDRLFEEYEFFCRYDLIQVKYEMVRRVQNDEVMGFVEQQIEKDPALRAPAIADLLEQEYGFTIHLGTPRYRFSPSTRLQFKHGDPDR